MRVLMTTDTVGGVWTFAQQFTEELLRQGHSVALVTIGRLPSESQRTWCRAKMLRWGRSFRVASSSAALEWMQDNEQAFEAAVPLLLSIARDFVPDVLLSNQFCFGALPLRIPRIVVAHSDVLSWAKACRGGSLPPSAWMHRYTKLVSNGIDGATAVVAPTHWMQTALAASFTLPEHTVVIPNGRSVPEPTGMVRRKRHHQAVSAGRFWDEAKNLQLLEKASLNMPVAIAGAVGDGPARRHGRSLSLRGELPEQQVLDLFRESEIYICTSIYEPFGLAPLEAALCGCAVVANDIPSLREVWGECALFYRGPDELSARVRELNDPARLREAQSRAYERASIFTPQRMTERYLHLFERLLRLQPAGARSRAHAA